MLFNEAPLQEESRGTVKASLHLVCGETLAFLYLVTDTYLAVRQLSD